VADLTDPSIRKDLRILLVSEVGGVEVFAAAERTAKNAWDRSMWEALHALEVKTRTAVYENLGDVAEQFSISKRATEIVGHGGGVGLALIPPRLQLRTLVAGTKAFLPRFVKLHNHFRGTGLEEFFGFVVAHEKAIAEVGNRGLARDPARLSAVEALLD
jgi:hypothetical protein